MKNLITCLFALFLMQTAFSQDEWFVADYYLPSDSVIDLKWAYDAEYPVYWRHEAGEHYLLGVDGSYPPVTAEDNTDHLIGSYFTSGIDYQLHIEHIAANFFLKADGVFITEVEPFEEDDFEIMSSLYPHSSGFTTVLVNYNTDELYFYNISMGLEVLFEGVEDADFPYVDVCLIDHQNAVLSTEFGQILHLYYDGASLLSYEYSLPLTGVFGVVRNPQDNQPILLSEDLGFIFLDLELGSCVVDFVITPTTLPHSESTWDWADYDCDGDGDLVMHYHAGKTVVWDSQLAQLENEFHAYSIFTTEPCIAPIAFVQWNGMGRYEIALAHKYEYISLLQSSNIWCAQPIPTITRSKELSTNDSLRKKQDLLVYPNPTSDNFSIDGLDEKDRVFVFNMFGELLVCFSGEKTIFDISDFVPGAYLVQIRSEEKNITRKIIKN